MFLMVFKPVGIKFTFLSLQMKMLISIILKKMVNSENDFGYQGLVLFGAPGNVGTRTIEKITEEDYPVGEHFLNDAIEVDIDAEKEKGQRIKTKLQEDVAAAREQANAKKSEYANEVLEARKNAQVEIDKSKLMADVKKDNNTFGK